MKIPAAALSLLLCLSLPAAAQDSHAHHHGPAESLGKVNFPISCAEESRADFLRGLAFLHSFGYEEARGSFASAASKDPACGIASWGVAMTYYHPIWAPPGPPELAAGRAASEKATAAGAKTDREKGYIAAIAAFYKDSDKVDHRTRALAYKSAMEDLSRRFPDDHEALIFYALSLLATAPPADPTYANQKKAAEILNGLLEKEPEHPGVAHYLIHSFDYPALASLALPAARSYSKIAPSSAHALHMPSHIFTRLGLWQESIESNLASADTARRYVARAHPGAESFDAAHAMDYLEYAYLQIGDEAKAKQVVEQAAAAKTFDEGSFAAGYALAAIPARYVLERRRWADAAKLEAPKADLPWDRFSYANAITPFAQALGAARTGQKEKARAALARIEEVHAGLVKSPIPGPYDWASQVESMRLAGSAWLAYADGKSDEALSLARSAADLEDKTGKHPVTPGSVLPARELLGDLLMEMKRPAEAMAEYEKSLKETPNRLNGLYGAARAAELSGNPEKARALYAQLLQNLGDRRPDREDVQQARAYLAKVKS
jgi:tetratricopeptide (TPR) repeat protein